MSDNTFPEEPLPAPAEKPKRTRAKDTSPMALAKLAATKLNAIEAKKSQLRISIGRAEAELKEQEESLDAFVVTLDEKVVAILKAGGSL
jgi:hypothetical protein